jgi:hypothetical protein
MKLVKIVSMLLFVLLLGSTILTMKPVIVKATPVDLNTTALPATEVPFDTVNGTVQVDPTVIEPIYYSVENDTGGHTIAAPGNGSDFVVKLWLRNATLGNVAAGVYAVEVHFNFSPIVSFARPLNYTDMLGQVGGVLNSTLDAPVQEVPYTGGFYDRLGFRATNPDGTPYPNATQYIVDGVATSGYSWWNNGRVATIWFRQNDTKSGSYPLTITSADLCDRGGAEVPFSIAQGTFDPLPTPGAPVYYSVEPAAPGSWIPGTYSQGPNSLEAFGWPSAIGQNFTISVYLRNATASNVPGGVFAVEVDLNFTAILGFCSVIAFFDPLTVILGRDLTYAIPAGFYDSSYNPLDPTNATQLAQARHYIVAAYANQSKAGNLWKGNAGLVAQVIFEIIAQPPIAGSAYLGSANLTYADLTTLRVSDVPFSEVNGTVQVDPVVVPPIYYSVENVTGGHTVDAPGNGNDFVVKLWLRNATVGNVVAGIGGVEVHFDFSAIVPVARPLNYTDMLGQVGGVLNSTLDGPVQYTYVGFYDSAGNNVTKADGSAWPNATQYIVSGGESSGYGWWNDGLVATIWFRQNDTKSGFYNLNVTKADLSDTNSNVVPFNIVQGVFDPLPTGVYYSVEPVAPGWIPGTYSQEPNNLEAFGWPSAVGRTFVVDVSLKNANASNVPGGVYSVEVDLNFTEIMAFCNVTAFYDVVGTTILGSDLHYTTPAGFYDNADNLLDPTNATQLDQARRYIVGAYADVSHVGALWSGNAALVAQIAFVIKAQPPLGGSAYVGWGSFIKTALTTIVGHDVAVTGLRSLDVTWDTSGIDKTVVGRDYPLHVNVTVANVGSLPETFLVALWVTHVADSVPWHVDNALVSLARGGTATIAMTWNTAGYAYGNYTVTAIAATVSGETYTANNIFTYDGKVLVTVPGDLTGLDGWGTVFLSDLGVMAPAWTAVPTSPNWNPNADITGIGSVFLPALGAMAPNFGKPGVTIPTGDP